jgi:hypothetical protein
MKKILIPIMLFVILGCVQAKPNRAVEVVVHNKTKGQSDFGNYHALLIYVEDYTYIPKLKTPKQDIEAVSKILKNRYGFNVKIIANPRNRDDLLLPLDKVVKKMTTNDNLLIYYAGHGSEKGMWQLTDAKFNSRIGEISTKEAVTNTLNLTKAKHVLVISDSCYAGLILRSPNLTRSGMGKCYYQLYKKKSRTALTSGGIERVSDTDPNKPNNSVFTNGFLRALNNNKKPLFTLQEKFVEISGYVRENAEQKPEYSNIIGTEHERGADFIFRDKTKKIKDCDAEPIPPTSCSLRFENFSRIGDCYVDNGETKEAIVYYKKSCNIKHNKKSCAILGQMYLKLLNDSEAKIYLRTACDLGVLSACKFFKK